MASTFSDTGPLDQIGVYEDDGTNPSNLLSGLKSLTIQANKRARVIAAPVETGHMSFDNKIIDPLQVVVKGIIVIDPESFETTNTIDTLNEMLESRKFKFYSAYDGTEYYPHLILQEFPRIRDVNQIDFLQVTLTFVQAMLVQKQAEPTASNSENSNIRNTGTAVANT